jgi:hypothetical protein
MTQESWQLFIGIKINLLDSLTETDYHSVTPRVDSRYFGGVSVAYLQFSVLCLFCFSSFCVLNPMLPVSLDYLLFIADLALSKVYLKHKEHEDCIGSDVKDVIRSGQNMKISSGPSL